jgi:hypothetical protein
MSISFIWIEPSHSFTPLCDPSLPNSAQVYDSISWDSGDGIHILNRIDSVVIYLCSRYLNTERNNVIHRTLLQNSFGDWSHETNNFHLLENPEKHISFPDQMGIDLWFTLTETNHSTLSFQCNSIKLESISTVCFRWKYLDVSTILKETVQVVLNIFSSPKRDSDNQIVDRKQCLGDFWDRSFQFVEFENVPIFFLRVKSSKGQFESLHNNSPFRSFGIVEIENVSDVQIGLSRT